MQGELFTAEVVSFPVDSRTFLIRHTARRLIELREDKEAATALWAETCFRVKADKLQSGWPIDDAKSDMDRFAESVTEEMRRVLWAEEARSHA